MTKEFEKRVERELAVETRKYILLDRDCLLCRNTKDR